jgi:hypothetical protein
MLNQRLFWGDAKQPGDALWQPRVTQNVIFDRTGQFSRIWPRSSSRRLKQPAQIEAGAQAVAVMSYVFAADDPAQAAAQLRAIVHQALAASCIRRFRLPGNERQNFQYPTVCLTDQHCAV